MEQIFIEQRSVESISQLVNLAAYHLPIGPSLLYCTGPMCLRWNCGIMGHCTLQPCTTEFLRCILVCPVYRLTETQVYRMVPTCTAVFGASQPSLLASPPEWLHTRKNVSSTEIPWPRTCYGHNVTWHYLSFVLVTHHPHDTDTIRHVSAAGAINRYLLLYYFDLHTFAALRNHFIMTLISNQRV